MTTAPAPDVLSLQELWQAADLLEREAVQRGAVGEAELDARRPGTSPAYADVTAGAWLSYHGWIAARAMGETHGSRRPLSQVVHEALAETPLPVTLRSGTRVAVYAKSIDALLFCEALDADLHLVHEQLCAAIVAAADDDGDVAGARLLERLVTRTAFRLYWWILTTEGPGLPFREDDAEPTPPDWTAALHLADVTALYEAHRTVNRDDLAFIAEAFPPERRETKSRLPLSGFLGAMAHEWGLPAREVMHGFSLRGLFAQAIVAAETHRAARAEARPAGRG